MKGRYELGNEWFIGGDVQYIRHKNDYKASFTGVYTNVAGGAPITEDVSWKGEVTVQEWHVAPHIAKKIGNFIPYFGVRYSDLRVAEKDDEGAKYKYKADDNFGIFLGTDYKIGENWKLNLEGRFVDETAMSFGATYKF
jgi:outer membrane protein W